MYTDGYIKLSRKLLDWGWYNDPNTARLFFHLLLCANYKDCEYHDIVIKRGQLVTGRKKLSEQLNMTEREIRTALEHLKATNDIAITSTSQYSIITINNYYEPPKTTSKMTNERPRSDQRVTNDRPQYNKDKNDKKYKKARNTRTGDLYELNDYDIESFKSKSLFKD